MFIVRTPTCNLSTFTQITNDGGATICVLYGEKEKALKNTPLFLSVEAHNYDTFIILFQRFMWGESLLKNNHSVRNK